MTTAVRRRRGTTAQHATFTGLEGEISIDTTKDTVVVHDGTTAGGHPLAKENNTALTGNVTVTTNSSSPALTITQDGTGNAFEVRDVTGDTTPFVVAGNGQVSFGHPTQPFFISGVVPNVASIGTSNVDGGFAAVRYSADAGGTFVHLAKSRGSAGSQGLVSSGDTAGAISFSASDGALFTPLAQIAAAVDGTPGTNDMPGRLVFSTTADGASSPTERMRIDSSGNVGIGTTLTPPAGKLSVLGGLTAWNDGASIPLIQWKNNNAGTDQKTWRVCGSTAGPLSFQTVNDAYSASMETLALYRDGKVLALNSIGLGYGTGSGGTVTQATSKSTAVTLNKPSGQITMHNAALAAGASVTFTLTNSTIVATDAIVLSGVSGASSYVFDTLSCAAGSTLLRVTNITGGSLSEAVVINFCVLKGSLS